MQREGLRDQRRRHRHIREGTAVIHIGVAVAEVDSVVGYDPWVVAVAVAAVVLNWQVKVAAYLTPAQGQ